MQQLRAFSLAEGRSHSNGSRSFARGSFLCAPLPPGVERVDGQTFRQVQRLSDARRQAVTDDLRGLGNRRSLFEHCMQRLESADAADRLDKYSLPAGALELEIPESVIMLDPERARTVLNALRRLGLRIAIDDYGTGYCALSYLQDLPVDELKLDRSFAARVATDARSAAIVRSTIELAHALGLQVVAEGVEDRQTLDAVTSFGCDYAQGYYFSRPVPAAAFAAAVRLADVDPGAEPSPLPPSLGGQLCSPRAVGPSHRRDHIGWASQEPGLAG